ncbi:hypothetical protein AB0L80_31630 [Streptomyces sp. NPDC052069]|uniref:hypothetical protein n=1 Tax=Streptomyces sp. NPDC052069 TaxID=3154650 RepID=UPI0034320253
MINLPENAPWWALLAVSTIFGAIYGGIQLWRLTWPQNSRDRRALLELRQRDRAERRKERTQLNQRDR